MSERIIVLTGAGGGLGGALTKLHLEAGDVVYGLEFAQIEVLRKLESQYEKLHAIHCDVTSDESVTEAIAKVKADGHDRVDIIYNVAGIFAEEGIVGIAETQLDMCKRMMDINAFGAIRVCKELWPCMQKDSLVVNISSDAGTITASRKTTEYAYCMSKAALNMASKMLSNELWEKQARVICFHPGWLKTPLGGPRAYASDRAIQPEEGAGNIFWIVNNIKDIPRDQMYMTHTGDILPW